MTTTVLLLSAATVLGFIGCAHSYLGERFVFSRLFALYDLPLLHNDRQYTERVLRFAWHLTSVAWWGFAALILALSDAIATTRVVGAITGSTLLLTGVIIVAAAGARHPAWWLFLVAGSMTLFATW